MVSSHPSPTLCGVISLIPVPYYGVISHPSAALYGVISHPIAALYGVIFLGMAILLVTAVRTEILTSLTL
jgi:hypothetical protein